MNSSKLRGILFAVSIVFTGGLAACGPEEEYPERGETAHVRQAMCPVDQDCEPEPEVTPPPSAARALLDHRGRLQRQWWFRDERQPGHPQRAGVDASERMFMGQWRQRSSSGQVLRDERPAPEQDRLSRRVRARQDAGRHVEREALDVGQRMGASLSIRGLRAGDGAMA